MAKSREIRQSLGAQVLLSDWFTAAQAEVELKAGNVNESLMLAQKTVELAKSIGGVFAEALAERIWGQALAASQSSLVAEVDSHMEQSLKVFENSSCVVEVARTHIIWAKMLVERADKAGGAEQAQKGVATFEMCDLVDELADARETLSDLN